jgi:UDP-N-acetyl-D-galactosamine dehydrogenase
MGICPDFESFINKSRKIAVVGLGYVGLPLAVHLAKHFSVIGYDFNRSRIDELAGGVDRTLEVEGKNLNSPNLNFSDDASLLKECSLIIVAVPTPVDSARIPDLKPIRDASISVGSNLSVNTCVVFESTVYPGVTEDICAPILERESGLRLGKNFTLGYSPERINPGDKVHTLDNIVKIVSASDRETLELLSGIYGRIVKAGIYPASSIRVAEAAKVIENTQRDINIALMNELSIIFNRMGLDTLDVLEAAGTKWNFLPFRPGLVGGHCIGVDPYYLTYKAESMGYHPEVILAGRRINDNMGKYIAEKVIKMLISANKQIRNTKVAVMGLTFKENIPDLRNTKVVDIIKELQDYGVEVLVNDPWASPADVEKCCGLKPVSLEEIRGVDAIVFAVAHSAYQELGVNRIASMYNDACPIIVDVKGIFLPSDIHKEGILYWRL